MNMDVLVALGFAFHLVFIAIVVWLFLWVRGRAPLRSPLWLVAYVVLSGSLSLITAPAMRHIIEHYTPLFGWTPGTLLLVLAHFGSGTDSLARCLVAVLVSSDVVFLVTKAGFDTQSRADSCFAPIRKRHILFGTSALGLAVITPLVIGILWMRTL